MQETRETWVLSLRFRRSPVGGNGNPLQCSCLENPVEEPGGLQSVTKSRIRLSNRTTPINSVHRSVPVSQYIFPSTPSVLTCLFSISALQTDSSISFSRFHINVLIYSICFSLSDLLYSVWQALRLPMSLPMTQFHSFCWFVLFLLLIYYYLILKFYISS